MNKCIKCDAEIDERETFFDSHKAYCGDCAIEAMMKTHGVSEREATHILERRQFGNGMHY